jgi:hypothetical protein
MNMAKNAAHAGITNGNGKDLILKTRVNKMKMIGLSRNAPSYQDGIAIPAKLSSFLVQ